MRRPRTQKDAPAQLHGIWRKYLQAQEFGQNYVPHSNRSKGNAGTCFKETRGERIRSRFKSINAHDEQKKVKLRELDTTRRSRTPAVVLTATGEVYTHEEAQVFVHDSNLFVTVQLLEETLAVLSLGKLCEDHGCSYEWKKTVKLHDGPKMGRQLLV